MVDRISIISVFKLIPARLVRADGQPEVYRRIGDPQRTESAVARIIATMAGSFCISVQILLDAFFGDHSLSFFFPAYGNHGNRICDNLRAARDLASREQ